MDAGRMGQPGKLAILPTGVFFFWAGRAAWSSWVFWVFFLLSLFFLGVEFKNLACFPNFFALTDDDGQVLGRASMKTEVAHERENNVLPLSFSPVQTELLFLSCHIITLACFASGVGLILQLLFAFSVRPRQKKETRSDILVVIRGISSCKLKGRVCLQTRPFFSVLSALRETLERRLSVNVTYATVCAMSPFPADCSSRK